MKNVGGRATGQREGLGMAGSEQSEKAEKRKERFKAEKKKVKRENMTGVECCCVCLVLFKGKLNYFTMLGLQRPQDSWAPFSSYLSAHGLTL